MEYLARATIIWLGFFVLAFVNGALRELGLKRLIEEPWAHHLSALTAVAFFSVYLYFIWAKLLVNNTTQCIYVGIYWIALTFLAETFIVGRLLGKHSWEEILSAYNISQGNLWPFVLIWIGLMPYMFFKLLK